MSPRAKRIYGLRAGNTNDDLQSGAESKYSQKSSVIATFQLGVLTESKTTGLINDVDIVGKFAGLGCSLGAAHGGFPLFQNLFRCAVNRKKKKEEIFLFFIVLFFPSFIFWRGPLVPTPFFKASPRDLSAILFLGTWRTFNKSFHTFLFFWCWEGKIGSLLGEHLGH